jgi:hypothetical protein
VRNKGLVLVSNLCLFWMLCASSGLFSSVCSLNANVLEHCVCPISIGGWVWSITRLVIPHTYLPMKVEQTECSETLAFKIQMPGNHPEDSTQQGAGYHNGTFCAGDPGCTTVFTQWDYSQDNQ